MRFALINNLAKCSFKNHTQKTFVFQNVLIHIFLQSPVEIMCVCIWFKAGRYTHTHLKTGQQ